MGSSGNSPADSHFQNIERGLTVNLAESYTHQSGLPAAPARSYAGAPSSRREASHFPTHGQPQNHPRDSSAPLPGSHGELPTGRGRAGGPVVTQQQQALPRGSSAPELMRDAHALLNIGRSGQLPPHQQSQNSGGSSSAYALRPDSHTPPMGSQSRAGAVAEARRAPTETAVAARAAGAQLAQNLADPRLANQMPMHTMPLHTQIEDLRQTQSTLQQFRSRFPIPHDLARVHQETVIPSLAPPMLPSPRPVPSPHPPPPPPPPPPPKPEQSSQGKRGPDQGDASQGDSKKPRSN